MSRQGEQQDAAGRMTIWSLLRNILPYVLPYRWLVAVTLVLTLIGSLMAQVNAVVLDRAVDSINALVQTPGGFAWSSAARILVIISVILLGKEVVGALVTFCQRYYGERMRILVSRDLSLRVVERMLSFRMAFFTAEGNETGKLQSRIDRGIMSLSNTVNNFFIEILPLFTSALLALVLMFAANVYVGLVALCIIPVYFYVTYIQAGRMKGGRRSIFGGHQAVSQGILSIIESITVIKSFNREQIEATRQADLQRSMTGLQLNMRKQSYMFNGLKSFLEQIGTVLIIILTASLDAIATEQIKASIDAIKQGRTVVIISHNIGQIIDADYIYVLEQGRVVQSGTPSDVYRQGGLYKEIFDASARSMNVDKIASTIDF